jgi:hypothetical protein
VFCELDVLLRCGASALGVAICGKDTLVGGTVIISGLICGKDILVGGTVIISGLGLESIKRGPADSLEGAIVISGEGGSGEP